MKRKMFAYAELPTFENSLRGRRINDVDRMNSVTNTGLISYFLVSIDAVCYSSAQHTPLVLLCRSMARILIAIQSVLLHKEVAVPSLFRTLSLNDLCDTNYFLSNVCAVDFIKLPSFWNMLFNESAFFTCNYMHILSDSYYTCQIEYVFAIYPWQLLACQQRIFSRKCNNNSSK